LFLIFIPTKAQKLKPILELDESKKYELYFIDVKIDTSRATYLENNAPHLDSVKKKTKINSTFLVSKKTGLIIKLDTIRNFRIEDQDLIINLSNKWKGKPTNEFYTCWYDYFIYLMEDNKIIDELRVNLKCEQVISSKGAFNFEGNPFESMTKRDKIYSAKIDFASVEQGRNFINDCKAINDLFFIDSDLPDWYKYDGAFYVKFPLKKRKDYENKIVENINKAYPGENFEIKISSYGLGSISYKVYCKKNLANAANLFNSHYDFEPFLVVYPIKIFFKDLSQIQGLIDKYIND